MQAPFIFDCLLNQPIFFFPTFLPAESPSRRIHAPSSLHPNSVLGLLKLSRTPIMKKIPNGSQHDIQTPHHQPYGSYHRSPDLWPYLTLLHAELDVPCAGPDHCRPLLCLTATSSPPCILTFRRGFPAAAFLSSATNHSGGNYGRRT